MDLSPTTTAQQSLPMVKSVTTKDRRFTIHWPLPKPSGKPVRIRATGASRLSAMQHRINTLINQGRTVVCPLSGKPIRIYWRGLHQSQVNTLRRLMEKSDKLGVSYLQVEFFSGRRDGDLAKLELWGLAARLRPDNKLEQEKMRGAWRITPHGRAFLAGEVRIPKQVAVLLGERLGYVDEAVTMSKDEVAEHFDREALTEGGDGVATPSDATEAVCR